ncbi:alpha-2-macroglobulin-like isoform X2 [Hyperolius riggenbachi]|uniref:alpha-2-macroglobulin-like isoform X2 n=1 Tax=Hyperolius riggenbachi TaxID=752182 RepID=UPI0035A32806
MASWALCSLVLLHLSWSIEASLHYAIIFPSEFHTEHPELFCIHLDGAQEDCQIVISLNLEDKNTTLAEDTCHHDSVHTCVPVQVPHSISQDKDVVGTVTVAITNAGDTITNSRKIIIKKTKSSILIQTDKAVYKPGQLVQFRIMAIDENFKPEEKTFPVAELQDPGKNRIAQWLDVKLNQGLAEFSFPLSAEPSLGQYSILVADTVHTFTVEEYVLPRFEVNVVAPKFVRFDLDAFSLQICGRYTYGKPIQGHFNATVCRKPHRWFSGIPDKTPVCLSFAGLLDKTGCHTVEVSTDNFRMNNTGMERDITAEATIIEQGTGIELSGSGKTTVTNVIYKISLVDADKNYRAGIPYNVVVKVVDADDNPKQDIKVYFQSTGGQSFLETALTDDKGRAHFTLNTTGWQGRKMFRANTVPTENPQYIHGLSKPDYGNAFLELNPFYSRSKSLLKLHSMEKVLPCEEQQDVEVEYIIRRAELKKEENKLQLHYLLTSNGVIQDHGFVTIKFEEGSEDIHGKTTLQITVRPGKFSTLRAIVYILLPNGEMLADSAKYSVQKCFKNKVSLGFSPDEVLPGSDISVQVHASPGSLCGLRVVDKSVVLMKPEKELTVDKVFNLFSTWDSENYDYRIQEFDDPCGFPDIRPPIFPRLSGLPPRRILLPWFFDRDVDVYTLFMRLRLIILTSAPIKKPVKCDDLPFKDTRGSGKQLILARGPDREVGSGGRRAPQDVLLARVAEVEEEKSPRTYFPETFLFELVATGTSGVGEVHKKAPDTITDWHGGAVCLGLEGFGMSSPSVLRVFQPFFVELTLPYSVVREETFVLKATVFNYMKQPMKIQTTLATSSELEEIPCEDCQYVSCLGGDESKTFRWNIKAKVLGHVNITVKTEALETKEFCNNEIPVVPKRGRSDTIIKPILVQPGGVLVEKSLSSLLCIQEEKGNSKTEEISLKVPENILKDSERAHVTVLGDLMGTALQNLDRLLAMPYGCGEQNMVLFAPNIFILQYLKKTHQLTDEIKSKATKFLEGGYQRQLTYKRDEGSYSAFGKNDKAGNTWLTAFVVKSFSKAQPYIFIDRSHLNDSFNWLKNHRNESGCFRSVGRLFNNAMKGGIEDEISLSAYVTIALLEAGLTAEDHVVSDALSCLRKAAVDVSNVYTQALLAYTFTLSGDAELRKSLLDKLDTKAVREAGQIHWKRDTEPPATDFYWYRAPSAEVEMTAYVLLAMMTSPEPDLGKAAEIVNWMSKQQNPYGGFSSTQDTVVALQALSEYAGHTYSDKGDIAVTVTSASGFLEKIQVDNNNRLLLQRAPLATIPGEYTVTATGSGCVFIQTTLRYNIPPPEKAAVFSITAKTVTNKDCIGAPVKSFEVSLLTKYTGSRETTNMIVIEVSMLSGHIPVKSTLRKLEKDKVIQRSDILADKVTLYLDHMDHSPVSISFMVEQDAEVKDLKAATVAIYDYYETDDRAVAEYHHPCSTDDNSGNTR